MLMMCLVRREYNKEQINGFDYFPQPGHYASGLVIRNEPLALMFSVDPYATHALEFIKYLDIVRSHIL